MTKTKPNPNTLDDNWIFVDAKKGVYEKCFSRKDAEWKKISADVRDLDEKHKQWFNEKSK